MGVPGRGGGGLARSCGYGYSARDSARRQDEASWEVEQQGKGITRSWGGYGTSRAARENRGGCRRGPVMGVNDSVHAFRPA